MKISKKCTGYANNTRLSIRIFQQGINDTTTDLLIMEYIMKLTKKTEIERIEQ